MLAVIALAALTAAAPVNTAAPEQAAETLVRDGRMAVADLGDAAVKGIEDVLKGLGLTGANLAKTVGDFKALPKGVKKEDVEKVVDNGLKSAGLKVGKVVMDAAVDAIFDLL